MVLNVKLVWIGILFLSTANVLGQNSFILGYDCLMEDNYDCAVDHFEQSRINGYSDSVEFHLALAHYLNDNSEISIEILSTLIDSFPEHIESSLLLSEIYEEAEEYGKASRALTLFIEQNPYNCEAYVERARITLNYWELDPHVADDLESALFFCNDSIATTVLLMLGEVYFMLEEYEKARNVYEDVLEHAPQDSAVIYDVASYLSEVGEYNRAIGLFESYHKTYPKDPDVYFQIGFCYLAAEDYKKSIENFNEYIRMDSADAEAWYNRGIAYAADQQYDFAIRDLKKAYQLDNSLIEARFNLGLVYQNKGVYDQAIRAYSDYILQIDDDPEAYYNRGYSKYYSDDPHGACADWLKLREMGYKYLWKEVKTLCPDY